MAPKVTLSAVVLPKTSSSGTVAIENESVSLPSKNLPSAF
jgi:hypothetical protein